MLSIRKTAPLALAFLSITTTAAQADGGRPLSLRELVAKADLVAEATVIAVSHRNSHVASPDHVALPHTFVTFQVEMALKGMVESEFLTLRMLGGPDGAGKVLDVAGTPRFAPGDREVLFVRGNGESMCPLVGWERGRLRVIGDHMYSTHGNELWLAQSGKLLLGDRTAAPGAALEETGPRVDGQVRRFAPPAGAFRLEQNAFVQALADMTSELHAAGAPAPAMVRSEDPAKPFFVQRFRPVAPPQTEAREREAAPLFRGVPDARETELIREERATRRGSE